MYICNAYFILQIVAYKTKFCVLTFQSFWNKLLIHLKKRLNFETCVPSNLKETGLLKIEINKNIIVGKKIRILGSKIPLWPSKDERSAHKNE